MARFNFSQNEEEVLKFWQENKIFEKSVVNREESNSYVFFDGPPFATGTPHYGHIVASLMKDVIPRFWTMKGKRVERRWGWDCHGLPIENLIEKELKLETKKDIEAMGVAKFNDACRASVMRYADEWKKIIPRIGRWVDMDNDYKTMNLSFMESIWWVFKTLWDRGLIYQGYKSMHLCPRCETTLSNFEVTQGYKDITDISAIVKFELIDEPKTFILAWTTTPWTLPGNVALAIGQEIKYIKVKKDGEKYVLAKDLYNKIFGEEQLKQEEINIKKLIGQKYAPLFNYFVDKKLDNQENLYTIQSADFVSTEDGTGVVHIAPAFGEDDMNLGKEKKLPFIKHVNVNGTFTDEVKDFAGRHVKPKNDPQEIDREIVEFLEKNKKLFASEKYNHSYPHCWRCDTPLLNYSASSWFVKVAGIKEQMLKNNSRTTWVPENLRDGRFGKWLEGARDWAISRSRYWGTPLPVWQSEDGQVICVGSAKELADLSGKKLTKLIFVRHGESEMNVLGRKSRQLDKYPLTDHGRRAVEETAAKFSGQVDLIISSPILRTKETAEIFQKKLGADLVFDDLLLEYNHGKWEDLTAEELLVNSEDYRKYHGLTLTERFNHRLGETGETKKEIISRVQKFVDKVAKEHSGKTIMVVSHGGIFAALNRAIREISDERYFFIEDNTPYNTPQYFYLNDEGKEWNLHKQIVDQIEINKESKIYRRVPEVLDCWFESGSMPYAEVHYPFENKEKFEKNFPAEFIAEGVDQTRGWFYTLMALSTALFDQPAFRNVVVNGIVLTEKGEKMSKRLKNYPDPMEIVSKYSADAMRYYLLTSPVMKADDICFSEKGVDEVFKKVFLTLWNVYSFYEMYAPGIDHEFKAESDHLLDRWILSKLNSLNKEITAQLIGYDLVKASRPIAEFIDELSTWYLRRSRDRFKGDDEPDKQCALHTLRQVLLTLSQLMAPFTPFIAETLYQKVVLADEKIESVHLTLWPEVDEKLIDVELLEQMTGARKIVELGHALRAENALKVRQPLARVYYYSNKLKLSDELSAIIRDELNIKAIAPAEDLAAGDSLKVKEDGGLKVALDIALDEQLIEEGFYRELVRYINALRKDAGLTIGDQVCLYYETDSEIIKKVFAKFNAEFRKDVLAVNIYAGKIAVEEKWQSEVEVGENKVIIRIRNTN